MNNSDGLREDVSALADGQLQGEALARLVERMGADDHLRSTWHTYHLVGDVLRTGSHGACGDTRVFVTRLRERLVSEAAAPHALEPVGVAAQVPVEASRDAANEPVFRWKLVAGVASVAAAAAIGWSWVGTLSTAPAGAQLAQQSQQNSPPGQLAVAQNPAPLAASQVLVGDRQQPQLMLRDPRLDALLEAHQQAGGASNMPSAFLRNATFEGPAR